MTEEIKSEAWNPETHVDEKPMDPLEKAKAGGYVEPEPPSHEDRVHALIERFEHVRKHNSPIAHDMMVELKALLAPKTEPVKSEGDADPVA